MSALKNVEMLNRKLSDLVAKRQAGIPRYYDNYVSYIFETVKRRLSTDPAGDALCEEDAVMHSLKRINGEIERAALGRLATWESRLIGPLKRDISEQAFVRSQGVMEGMQWRGLPLLKSVYDFAIIPMLLFELRPSTIIELGSGSGASALWLSDITSLAGLNSQIISIDLIKPTLDADRVRFIQGDARSLRASLSDLQYDRPLLIIEDAHTAVSQAIEFFVSVARPGDYLVIEDSDGKRAEITSSLSKCDHRVFVDTKFMDYFGRNVTSCADSIFVKV